MGYDKRRRTGGSWKVDWAGEFGNAQVVGSWEVHWAGGVCEAHGSEELWAAHLLVEN